MKFAIAALLLIPAGLFVHSRRSVNLKYNDAFTTYQRFADAFHHDRIAECRSISDGVSVKSSIDAREKRFFELVKAGATDAATMTVVSTTYERTSQSVSGDDVAFSAVMTVKFMPAGVYSSRNIPQTRYRHDVTLRHGGAGWAVVEFRESELK